ncbi:HNH endonuclease [Paenibacillus provencensis]|uniref:HNH endonuclease n=1 Tax=Paenibacillus provencensis TaxID=441151 RepID=A0ABW3PU31_9BACL
MKDHLRKCELCNRVVPVTTVHHLTPRELGGSHKETVNLCIPCHKQIHHLFTNRELVVLGLTSIEALKSDPKISSYLNWIYQPPFQDPLIKACSKPGR